MKEGLPAAAVGARQSAIAAIGLVVWLTGGAGPALGQNGAWTAMPTDEAPAGVRRPAVGITNPEGFGFSVEVLPGARGALCALTLPDDASSDVDGGDLPVLEVDAREPQQIARWQPSEGWEDGGDFAEALRRELGLLPLVDMGERRIAFHCWQPLPRQVAPTRGLLRQIVDGRELLVRLTLAGGEHRETTFSLADARRAIGEGLDLPLEPSRRDVLQDELLAFRVDYRKTTCYLLNGRKRQKRCLEAVETCRGRDHDSVLSMLGCIESE